MCLHFGQGAVPLCGAQAGEVELAHLLGLHSLGRQGAQAAFQARVHLVLHQRLGNRESEPFGERGKEPVFGFSLHVAALAVGEVLANAGLELGIAFVMAELLGEVVVQLGQRALLDGLDFDVVGDCFAGELGLGIVGGINDLDLEFLAGLCAAQCSW